MIKVGQLVRLNAAASLHAQAYVWGGALGLVVDSQVDRGGYLKVLVTHGRAGGNGSRHIIIAESDIREVVR